MQGHEVHFVGADDAHGAPIMLAAEKAGKTPGGVRRRDRRRAASATSTASTSRFDNWHSTALAGEHRAVAGHLPPAEGGRARSTRSTIEQFFDPVKGMFLADRYIKGECPNCGAKDQYGDACENCSSGLLADRAEEPVLDALRRDAGAEVLGALLLQALRPEVRRVPEGLDAGRAGCSRRSSTRRGNGSRARATRRSPTGTSRATRPTSASRSRTRRASTSTSGSTRRSAISPPEELLRRGKAQRTASAGLRGVPRRPATPSRSTSSARTSSTSTRCSGRRCCKFAGRLQVPGPRLRARLHHRVRREDVQVARHRHRPAALPRARA